MKAASLFALFLAAGAMGADLPKGAALIKETNSPDGEFGVAEPAGGNSKHNQLIELKTGRIVAEIEGWPGASKMNHGKVKAGWARDSKRLLWIVGGKWGPLAMTVIELKEKDAAAQVDVLKAAHAEILARTRKAHPKSYAAAKEWNEGSGAAYPDGFAIGALLPKSADLPLRFAFALTSNPKQIESRPQLAQLDAFIEGTLGAGQKLEWSNFHAWDATAGEREQAELEGVGEGLANVQDDVGNKLSGAAKKKFDAECAAWDAKQKRLLGDDTELATLSDLERTRRSRIATNARIDELQKQSPPEKKKP